MESLTERDLELIKIASETITKNYDKVNYNHTVGAAVRCKNGKVYTGVNVYSIHGACAEIIAIGSAITDGEREFESIVAIRGESGDEILPPCGNCRQFLSEYMPDCKVIFKINDEFEKITVKELLPYSHLITE